MKTNNNRKNNILNLSSGSKKTLRNIDNNFDYSDSDEENNENSKKVINNYKLTNSNSNIKNVADNRIKNFNLNRSNPDKPNTYRVNMKKNSSNNINFNRGYSAQINDNNYAFNNNNFNNIKQRSFSGEKNYKPINNFYGLTEEKKYNSINRITSYNSKLQKNRNMQSNFPPTNANTKVIKLNKNILEENKANIYPSFDNNIRSNAFNNTFNPSYNTRIINNNYYPSQPQNYNQNNITPIGNNYIIGMNKIPTNINNNYTNASQIPNNNIVQPMPSINNINNINQDYIPPRANNTIGYLTYKKQNLINNNINANNNFQGYKTENQPGIINLNQAPFAMQNQEEDDDDGRFHEISITKNFSRFSKPSPFPKPMGFDQVLKQQQMNQSNNIRDNNQNGRRTFVKKLPPENNLNMVNNNMVNNNMMNNNNNQLKSGISGNVLNNPINRSNSNNIVNLGENNEQIRNTFGNSNINIKKIPPEVNNNISLQRANAPINNMIPNAASFNRNVQNLNELNNNPNHILPSRNININISPNNPTPIINTQQQINYNLNNQIIPQIPPKDILADSANPEIIKQKSQEEINTKEYEEQNDDNIEQNEENDNVLQDEEPNPEQNIQENEDQYIEQKEEQNEEQNADQNEVQNEEENQEKKDPNISYNEFDFTGLLKNYGGLSRQGIDANGNQKTNQDTLVSLTNINKIKDFNIFGVLDGHGVDGHHVSNYASEFIPSQIINNPEIKELSDPELIYQKLKENNCQIITEAFLSCDEQLKNAEFDAFGSGSTCILIIHIGQHILCANVGDSRALVAYDDNKEDQELNYLEQAQLSIDYKPDLEEEKNRILLSGGVVEQMQNQFGEGVGPYRVWVKGEDYPGLAMSRSIGDLKGKTIGVISEPGILEYDVNETTKFVVIASDGVWEFLRNETVLEIGKEFYINNDTSALCHKIVDTSVSVWQEKDVVVDDITVVVMFF